MADYITVYSSHPEEHLPLIRVWPIPGAIWLFQDENAIEIPLGQFGDVADAMGEGMKIAANITD